MQKRKSQIWIYPKCSRNPAKTKALTADQELYVIFTSILLL